MQIVFREWRVRIVPETRLPILQSSYQPTFWDGPELTADQPPEDDLNVNRLSQLHGIHVVNGDYPLPYMQPLFLKTMRSHGGWPWVMLLVVGALDVSGKVVEHADGVLRAEHVKILALRVDERVWVRPPCGHDEYGVYSGLRQDCWVLRRLCGGQTKCRHDLPMPDEFLYGMSAELQFRTDLTWVEQKLCERYEVPRLPADAGPWARRGPLQSAVAEPQW